MADLKWKILAIGISGFLVLSAAVSEKISAEEIHAQGSAMSSEQVSDSLTLDGAAAEGLSADWVCVVLIGELAVISAGAWIVTHAPGK